MGELVEEKKEESVKIPMEEAKPIPPKVEKTPEPVAKPAEKKTPISKSTSKPTPKAKSQSKPELSSPMVRQEAFVQLKESVYQEVGMHFIVLHRIVLKWRGAQ